tara:strand:- start:851 stop:1594 length:744 start_codon:yes stop_codon:yes gene_type:complete
MHIKSTKLKLLSLLSDLVQFICRPLTFLQGYLIRKRTIELPEASGKRTGRVGSGQKLSILIVGDSSACGVGVEKIKDSLSGHIMDAIKLRINCRWKILAKSGLTTDGLIKLIEDHPEDQFEVAITAIGMNDIVAGKNAEKWVQEMYRVYQLLSKKYEISNIIMSGLPPVRKLKHVPPPLLWIISLKAFVFDSYLKIVCDKLKNGYYIENDFPVTKETMAADRFHPNSAYYKKWAISIGEKVKDIYSA